MRKELGTTRKWSLPPVLLISFTFIALICIGTILLMLPISNNSGKFFPFVHALFTATSAVCVTGLVVADTLTQFTFFGQLVIITLIQCGGLGLMTFATLMFIFIGKKITLKDRLVLQEAYGDNNLTGLLKLTQNIMKLTFAIEFFGAFVLSLFFIPKYGYIVGSWYSIFHAISAFCNAGFDILGGGTSLMRFYSHPLPILTISFLVIFGGIGFGVILDVIKTIKGKTLHLQQNTRAVLTVTGCLIAVGWVLFFIFEYNNPRTMSHMTLPDKIINSFVQSVMPRTAGFATINQGGLTHLSTSLTECLMFIGASPASTGGGIKTTTFLVLILMFIAGSKGEDEILLSGKSVSQQICLKAVAIVFLAIIVISAVSTAVFSIELARGNAVAGLSEVIYEVISAFGTVGLSMGITSSLSNASLLLISGVMLIGRLGTLCLTLIFLRGNKKNHLNIKHPSAKLVI